MAKVEPGWNRYGAALAHLLLQGPGGTHEKVTQVLLAAIDSGRSDLKFRVRKRLLGFEEQSGKIRCSFQQEIEEILSPEFDKAAIITGQYCGAWCASSNANFLAGIGARHERDQVLQRFIKDHLKSSSMFRRASEKLAAELLDRLQHCAIDLERMARGSVQLVEKQVQSLLGGRKSAASPAVQNIILQLQEQTKHDLASWRECWETPPSPREDHVMRGDMRIPEPVLIKVEDDEDCVQAEVSGVADTSMILGKEEPV